MATTILDLPFELISNIFQCLEDADFFAARPVCKHLERASLSTFGRRFFRKRGYMITTPSLNVLQNIAAHEELRPYVQHVWFNPDCYTFGPPLQPLNYFDDWEMIEAEDKYSDDRETNRKNHEAHAACMRDHDAFLYLDGKLADELKMAFASLPNLKTVGMRRSDQHKPWGWKTLRDSIGKDPRELGHRSWISQTRNDPSEPTRLYVAIIKALSNSGVRLQRLYTDAIEIDLIPLPTDIIKEACGSLLYLEVNVTKSPVQRVAEESPEAHGVRKASRYGSGLNILLSASPKLRELGLMIFPERKESHFMSPDEGWLGSYPHLTMTRLAGAVKLQNLRRIKLERFTTTSSTLIALLRPSAKHLTSIKLRDIRLLKDPGSDVDKPWEPIFLFLALSCPKLSYLLLYHLSHHTGTIRFTPEAPQPAVDANTDAPSADSLANPVNFTAYENISFEAGVPHSDPDTEGPDKRATIVRTREAVGERVRALVKGHWYGRNAFCYEMDERVWHTDTSDDEW